MKKIIVMGIPHHGNIGDNAIAVAEEELLSKYFSDYKIYCFYFIIFFKKGHIF